MCVGIVLVINWCSRIQSTVSCTVPKQVCITDSYIWVYKLPENEPASIFFLQIPALTSLRDRWKSVNVSWKTLSFPSNIWSERSITATERKLGHQLSQATVGSIWLSSDRRYVENLEKAFSSKPEERTPEMLELSLTFQEWPQRPFPVSKQPVTESVGRKGVWRTLRSPSTHVWQTK